MMKDNFSEQAKEYAKFRPDYPEDLFSYLFSQINGWDAAWDCATGNGQIAVVLADRFAQVFATDISSKQLEHASHRPNVIYQTGSAENSGLPSDTFDLITVGQAIHWFDFSAFYVEAERVARKGCLLALIGYDLPETEEAVNIRLRDFYENTLGAYWDPERKYIDDHYHSLPFPYKEIPSPPFFQTLNWDRSEFEGFLSTWSGLLHYRKKTGSDPLPDFIASLESFWNADEKKAFRFPILLKIARIKE
jgi:ubiquinone/menaquinone biosynthesis C-methylase UbiE